MNTSTTTPKLTAAATLLACAGMAAADSDFRIDSVAESSPHTDQVRHGAWSPDGTRVLSWADDRTVRLWDPGDEARTQTLEHDTTLQHASWTADGSFIVSGTLDNRVFIWNAESGERVRSFNLPRSPLVRTFSGADEDVVLLVNARRELFAWSASDPQAAPTRLDEIGRPMFADHSPADSALLTVDGGELTLWQYERDSIEQVWSRRIDGDIFSAAWSHDGQQIAIGYGEIEMSPRMINMNANEPEDASPMGVQVWSAAEGDKLTSFATEAGMPVHQLAWSPDGEHLITIASEMEATLWHLDGHGDVTPTHLHHEPRIRDIRFDASGRTAILQMTDMSGADSHTLRFWDVTSAEPLGERTFNTDAMFFDLNPDETHLITASEDDGHALRLWRIDRGSTRRADAPQFQILEP